MLRFMVQKMDSHTKARIKWRCRRGMLELDLLLGRFIENKLDSLSVEQMATFERLLLTPDPDLFYWLMSAEGPEDQELKDFVQFIKQHQSGDL